MAVDGVDDLALVDEYVVELDGPARCHRRGRRHEHADLLRLVWIGDVVGAQAAVEEGAEHDLVGLPGGRQRHVLVNVVGAEAALRRERLVVGQGASRDRHQVVLVARVEHPDQFGPIRGVVLGRFVRHQHQSAIEQRHHRVHKAGIGRRVRPRRDQLRVGLVRDVEHEHAAVDISEIEPVRTLRIDVGVVRAIALVERVARRRHHVVALLGAGHVPAADLDRLRRVAHVDAAIELVVVGMRRQEVGRARGAMHVFAVAEPELMHAARGLARAVEERDRARLLRHRDVEQLHAGRLLTLFLGLVSDGHDVPAGLQRVGAHVRLRQVGLHHDLGLARIGDVDGSKILRRALVRQPEDAAAVRRDLNRHALAHAAEPVEQVVAEQLEIPGDGLAVAAQRALSGRRCLRRGLLGGCFFRGGFLRG